MKEETVYCVTDQPRLTCNVPYVTLTQTPYLLQQGEEVKAQVSAYNVNGWSLYSTLTTLGTLI